VLGDSWVAYHLYYHEDLDRAVHGFVLPLVTSLFEDDRIDRFFFIRYKLGGPHIRLRLRVMPGRMEEVELAVRRQAQRFLTLHPSRKSPAPEILLKTTQSMIARDPSETDATIYPDNTLRSASFQAEVERYGGPGLIGSSIDFFAVSSVGALLFLSRNRDRPRTLQLGAALRLLLCQALGFAADEDELAALLGYGEDNGAASNPAIVAKGDRVFEKRPETFHAMFREEVRALENSGLSEAPELPLLGAAALALSQSLGRDTGLRRRIGSSQLHMTANRLGLLNPEEVYLGRMLTRTYRELRKADPELWKDLRELLRERSRPSDVLPVLDPPLLRRALGEVVSRYGGEQE